jgi:TolB-like protein/Tfp pilus assembly protein PilF
MSSDAEQEYFSDGISEEILNSLAKVRELKVAGRTSSFAFKGQNQDLRQIGQTLGVENILEGSVRKAGTRVRITAQLIQVEDGFHLWSETYERELTDVFAIQDEIALAILEQLKAHLIDEEFIAQTTTRTDSKVYDLYLLARQRIYERKPETIKFAADLLDEALLLDTAYAPALALRGIAELLMKERSYGNLSVEQATRQARVFLEKARNLDPGLAEVWAGLGLYHLSLPRSEYEESIAALKKALAINPNMIDASNWLSIALQDAGRHAESFNIVEQMVERDPLYPPAAGNVINDWNLRGMQDKSLALIERIRPMMSGNPLLLRNEAVTHYSMGEWARGLALAEEAYRQRPEDGVIKGAFNFGLMATHQYERALELDLPFGKSFALSQLSRTEEATMVAYEQAGRGFIGPLLFILLSEGREKDLIRFIEERWTDLDALAAEYPPGDSGYVLMTNIAVAYKRIGNEERFLDAMQRVEEALKQSRAMGVKNPFFRLQNAIYLTLSDKHEDALDELDAAVQGGILTTFRIADGWVVLKELETYPRFQEIQERMIEHLQAERATLGLEPVAI